MPTYQPNIPTGTVDLDQDYLNLQGNFQQLDIAYGYDHVPFSNTSGLFPGGVAGMHQSIHLNPVSTTATNPPNNQPVIPPATTGGFGQVFSAQINDGINIDEALYYLSGGGRLSQLTRNFTPLAANIGYTFLPGGIIEMWGNAVSTSGGSTANLTVTFPLVSPTGFPSALYNVQILVLEASNSRRIWHLNSVSISGFTAYIQDNNGSNVANAVYWTALGK